MHYPAPETARYTGVFFPSRGEVSTNERRSVMPTATKPRRATGLGPPSADDIAAGAAAQGTLIPVADSEIEKALRKTSGVTGDITKRMLEAETIEDLLGGTEPTAALVGVTFALVGWKWLRSQVAGGTGIFALLEVRDLNGKDRQVTSGSQNILTALLWFQQHAVKKVPALTVRESTTSDGNTVYRFAKPDRKSVV